MKSLTVRQPWAHAIASLGKDVENRTWNTTYRGPLAIHAGSRWDGPEAHRCVAATAGCHPKDVKVTEAEMSAIIAVVDLVDVCDGRRPIDEGCDCGPWAMPDQYHWRLANPRPLLEPVPCKGRLGLWDLPVFVEQTVLASVASLVGEVSR